VIKNWDAIKQINLDKYDIILLYEIWQVRDFEHIKIPNFSLATIKQREVTRGGGSLIFVRNTLVYEIFESPFIEGLIETSSIIIDNVVIMSVYRPPSVWSKIGRRREHTNTRLRQNNILKIEDELKIAEIKLIWR